MNERARILHLHSTFSLGGKEARAVRLMNDLGDRACHTILSAMPEALSARDMIDPTIKVSFPEQAPSLTGKPSLARYRSLVRYMTGFDLVLSYNWGAMDGVMAHRLSGTSLPPIIHHEDGFNADEAIRLKRRRTIFRRLAFPTLHRLVVPSDRLRKIARDIWKQPDDRVYQIANGIDTAAYTADPVPGSLPGFVPGQNDIVVGTIAGLREVKDLTRLVRAVAGLPENIKLVIVGEGPDRLAIETEAERTGLKNRLTMTGFLDRPWRYIGQFDVFALSSKSEQFPISVVEAMAAGLPVAAPDVGDIGAMVASANGPFVGGGEAGALARAIDKLCGDRDLRATIGAANRAKAQSRFDEADMLQHYRALYGGAIGRPDLFTV